MLQNKSLGPQDFAGKCYQAFKEEITLFSYNLIQNTGDEILFTHSSDKASIMLVPKPNKNSTKKEYYRPVYLMIIGMKNTLQKCGQIKTAI